MSNRHERSILEYERKSINKHVYSTVSIPHGDILSTKERGIQYEYS